MERVNKLDRFSDFKIKDREYKRNEIISSLVMKIFGLILSIISLVFVFIHYLKFTDIGMIFTYYEIYMVMLNIVVYLIFSIGEISFLINKKSFLNDSLYKVKFMSLGANINYIFIFFLTLPVLFKNIEIFYLILPILLIILSIFSLIDFLEFDYSFNSKRTISYYFILVPVIYIILFIILSYSGVRWVNISESIESNKIINNDVAPYPFLNYINNTWFNGQYSSFNLSEGYYGFSVFYILFLGLVINMIIALVINYIKNRKLIRVYKITYNKESYHSEI